jgi:hypothetical protein
MGGTGVLKNMICFREGDGWYWCPEEHVLFQGR